MTVKLLKERMRSESQRPLTVVVYMNLMRLMNETREKLGSAQNPSTTA